jgi:Tol biopolymer transport system component
LRSVLAGCSVPIREALRIGIEMAEGLGKAHQARVVHRDLKPENVMVTADGHIKILDFGLAKFLEDETISASEISRLETISGEMSQLGRILGTASYMSPEQTRGQAVDGRSDLFSFGIVLYEMVTGKTPFRGPTPMDTLGAILHKPVVPASRINSEVPVELERILGKCLEKDPAERYQDTRDLVVDLRRLKRDTEPGAATGSSATEQKETLKDTKRRSMVRAILWAGIAAALAAIGFGAWRLWLRAPGSRPPSQRLVLSGDEVGNSVSVSLSPDGRYLAFESQGVLHTRDLENESTRSIALPHGQTVRGATWSADGRQLLTNCQYGKGHSICAVSVVTGAARRLFDGESWDPTPSPDGKLLTFVSDSGPHKEIWLTGVQGDSPRRVVSLEEGEGVARLAWAPNLRWLAVLRVRFSSASAPRAVVEIVSLDGRQTTVLLSDPKLWWLNGGIGQLAWLPDGRILYSLSEPPPNGSDMNVWGIQMDLRTGRGVGEPSRLTSWAGTAAFVLEATADGRHLLVGRTTAQRDAYIGTLDSNGGRLREERRLTLSSRNDDPYGWTRDGRLLFASDRNGTWDIFVQAIDSREATSLVVGPENEFLPQENPDGTSVFYGVTHDPINTAEEGTLMRLDLADGTSRAILKMQHFSDLHCPSLPGTSCVVGEMMGKGAIVFNLFDPRGGKGREFARLSGSYGWDLSPDGRHLAFSALSLTHDIWLLDNP